LRINAKQYRRNANSKKRGESAHPVPPKLTWPVEAGRPAVFPVARPAPAPWNRAGAELFY
ncbi:hypothetical protein ABTK05_21175, partial [Acinetobacter baumannii]